MHLLRIAPITLLLLGLAASSTGAPRTRGAAALTRDSFGHSGALRAALALPGSRVDVRLDASADAYRWIPVLGTMVPSESPTLLGDGQALRAPAHSGTFELEVRRGGAWLPVEDWRLIVLVPFSEKRDGRLRGYFIGHYPTEGQQRTDRYAPPAGFIEVTPANKDLLLSDHFRLREFLTHDQKNVWPKYAYVEPRLLDKLELVMDDLESQGIPAQRMIVMSGFRTPQYNRQGLASGRASLSRHQFGDAADVWVDNDGDWYMDDLNGDGRRDTADSRVMLRAVERVERRFPALVGGTGIYRDNGVHGPFIHIDVRGRPARW